MKTLFGKDIDDIIKRAYDKQNQMDFDRLEFVNLLQQCYRNYDKSDRDSILVPFSYLTVDDNQPVYLDELGQPVIKYKWNEGHNSEFSGPIEENAIIQKGTLLDRLGKPTGKYVSPVYSEISIYSVAQRALPYYFLETGVVLEPSYHRYRVQKDISQSNLIKAIENDSKTYYNQALKEAAIEDVNRYNGVTYGLVAPIEAFLLQGVGGGEQYKLPISVAELVSLEFLEEWEGYSDESEAQNYFGG